MLIQSPKTTIDPILEKHLTILKTESKFRAKLLYTLTCITAHLFPQKGQLYQFNIQYLASQSKIFLQIIIMYCDTVVLEIISFLYRKFQEIPVKGIAGNLLDVVYLRQIKGDFSQQLVINVCRMLTMLRHEYEHIKPICMKILRDSKLTRKSIEVLLRTMTNSCSLSQEQCYQLCQLEYIPSVVVLSQLWLNCLNTRNTNQLPTSPNSQSLQYKILTQYLNKQWSDQLVKHMCMRISLWNATNSVGDVGELVPQFIQRYYRNRIKPVWEGALKKGIEYIGEILQHVANQYIHIDEQQFIYQIKKLSSQLSKYRQHSQLLCDISAKQELPPATQLKHLFILPIQFLSTPDAIQKKLLGVPTICNAFKTLIKLNQLEFHYEIERYQIVRIYLVLLEIYLKNKGCLGLKAVEKNIGEKLENDSNYMISLLIKNQQYCLFVGCAKEIMEKCTQKQKQQIYEKINNYLGKKNVAVQHKFYLGGSLIKLRYKKGVKIFLSYLSNDLEKQNLVYEQLLYYAQQNNYFTEQQLQWITDNFYKQMQILLQKIFVKLTDRDFKPCKYFILKLQQYNIFHQWHIIYRWTINALDEPNIQNPESLIDSFNVFHNVIKNCKQIPLQIIKKFFSIVAKYWQYYNHHHMVAAEQICRFLFTTQNLGSNQLEDLTCYINQLINKPLKIQNSGSIYKCSFSLMLNKILKVQTQMMEKKLMEDVEKQLCQLSENTPKTYQILKIKLFSQQVLMWFLHLTGSQLNPSLSSKLLQILNTQDHYLVVNKSDLQLLIQNSVQIIATGKHKCDLLSLSLMKIFRNYPLNKQMVLFAREIVCVIKQINIQMLKQYQLYKVIPQLFSTLILSADSSISIAYIQFITQLCADEKSPYHKIFTHNIMKFAQILSTEQLFVIGKYQTDILCFIFQHLNHHCDIRIAKKWASGIWLKYHCNDDIRKLCQYIEQYQQPNKTAIRQYQQQQDEMENRDNVEENNLSTNDVVGTESGIGSGNEGSQGLGDEDEDENQKEEEVEEEEKQISGEQLENIEDKNNRDTDIQEQKQHIAKIKASINYLSSIANIKIDRTKIAKLEDTLSYLAEVVGMHTYFCQKVIQLDVVGKCLELHYEVQKIVQLQILGVFQKISRCKDKNLGIFNDDHSIKFFKKILKESINSHMELPGNQIILRIVEKCWNCSFDFYSQGLLTVLFEMVKQDISREKILLFFCSNTLSFQIVTEIYQHGLLNIAEAVFAMENTSLFSKDKQQLIYWTRLLSKMCINKIIRQKLLQLHFHTLSYNKISIYKQMCGLNNLAYFYSQLMLQLQQFRKWCLQVKIHEYFLGEMEKQDGNGNGDGYRYGCEGFYQFFREFGLGGGMYIEEMFKIGYHLYLIKVLQQEKIQLQSDQFQSYCSSLSPLFDSQHYQIFLTKQILRHLLSSYKKSQKSCLIKCIQKLVQQISSIDQLSIIQTQKIYEINYDDDISYGYVLEMYMKLLKKFKKFNTEVFNYRFASVVMKKAVVSANMEGKKKSLQFLMEFAQIDKIRYGYAVCYKIFQAIFNNNLSYNQLQLLYRFEKNQLRNNQIPKQISQIEGEIKQMSQQKQRIVQGFVSEIQVKSLLAKKYIQLRNSLQNRLSNFDTINTQLTITLQILFLFLKFQHNSIFYFQKLKTPLLKISSNFPLCFQSSVELISQFMKFRILDDSFRNSTNLVINYLDKITQYINNMRQDNQKLVDAYIDIIDNCIKNNIVDRSLIQKLIQQKIENFVPKNDYFRVKVLSSYKNSQFNGQLTSNMKQIMKKGIKVKMYKSDNSSSNLMLYFTEDLLEVNCVSAIGNQVKNKWKLPIPQISLIETYNNEQLYKKSIFYLSQGFFTRAPQMQNCLALIGKQKCKSFYICFQNIIQLKQWKKYFFIMMKCGKKKLYR